MKNYFYFYLGLKNNFKTIEYSNDHEKNKSFAIKNNDIHILKYYNYNISFTVNRFIDSYNKKIYRIIEQYIKQFDVFYLINKIYIPNLSKIKRIDYKIHKMFKEKLPNIEDYLLYDKFNIIENNFDSQYYVNRFTDNTFKLVFQPILDEFIKINNNEIIKSVIDINRFKITSKNIYDCYKYNNYEILNYLLKNEDYKIKIFRTIVRINDIPKIKYILEKYYFGNTIFSSDIKSQEMYRYLISNKFNISEKELIKLAINLDSIDLIADKYVKMNYEEKENIIINSILKNKLEIVRKIIKDEKWDITKFKFKKNKTKDFIKEYFKTIQN